MINLSYVFFGTSLVLLLSFIIFYYVFRLSELINKSKVASTYFIQKKTKISNKFFDIVNKKIFIVQITFLSILIGLLLFFILSIVGCAKELADNKNKILGWICLVMSFVALVPTLTTYLYYIIILNKSKIILDEWKKENETFIGDLILNIALGKSPIFVKKTKFVYFDPQSNNKGSKYTNKHILKMIQNKEENLSEKLYYSIIIAYDTTTLNNLFYSYDGVYAEYKTLCEELNLEPIK